MRKLGLKDVFAFSEIIDKMNIKVDLNNLMNEAMASDDPQSYAGGAMTMMLITNLHKAQEPIVNWLADLTGKTVDEVESLDFKEFTEIIGSIFESDDIGAFLNFLSLKE